MTTSARRRWVMHVDMDQFIAAVEVLRNPELAGKQVVVGGRGDPTERGVVSTASYEARAFGVGSGMPLRVAVRKLPDAIFLPVDAEAYSAASNSVMDTLRSLGVVVEVMGWDEAFLGVDTADPVSFARTVHDAVFAATGLHCSVGIGDNKLRAKIATDFGKPQGIYTLTNENRFEVMGERTTDALWGIGKKTAKKLAALGSPPYRSWRRRTVSYLPLPSARRQVRGSGRRAAASMTRQYRRNRGSRARTAAKRHSNRI